MRRRIYDRLVEWKDSPDRRPLILEGVRQCGKTYIMREFGKENYRSVIYLNFEKNEGLGELFDGELDPKVIIGHIIRLTSRRVTEGDTLIIFDEVQAVPRALTSLKYFCEEAPGYHIICAGSLLGLLTSRPDSFPVGKVDRLRMYPMDFGEFLWAEGEDGLAEFIGSWRPGDRIQGIFHSRLRAHLEDYLFVGGMPAAVRSWTERHDPSHVTGVLKGILEDYRKDLSKHAGDILPKVVAVWDALPGELAKENRRFICGHVMRDARPNDLMGAVLWIVNAGLAHRVCRVEVPSVPLRSNSDRTFFKLYASDVGLLRVMSGRRTYRTGDPGDDRIYRGAAAENLAVCQLLSAGAEELFYWRDGRYEIDLLIDTDSGPVPVEVKSGDNTNAVSLRAYSERYSPEKMFLTSTSDASGGTWGHVPLYCSGTIPSSCGAEVSKDSDPVGPGERRRDVWRMFFDAGDWEPCGGICTLTVRRRAHGIARPRSVNVYRRAGDTYTRVEAETSVDLGGNVMVGSDEPYDGFVEIS